MARRSKYKIQPIVEEWRETQEFPSVLVSNLGRFVNADTGQEISVSPNNFGHMRVNLPTDDYTHIYDGDGNLIKTLRVRATRSAALLVAQAFVEPPSVICDHVILLDGNLSNVAAQNLAWRPARFSWLYTHQLRCHQPIYYQNLEVTNLQRNIAYDSIVQAGMMEGLLFDDIWKSTYSGSRVFPYGHVFEVTERV